MNEMSISIDGLSHALYISKNLNAKLLENINEIQIPSSQQDKLKFTALATKSKSPLLLSLFFVA